MPSPLSKSTNGLKVHQRACRSIPGSRTGQKTVEQIKHLRRKDIWKRLDAAEMGNATLPNCYTFPYLGVHSAGDGREAFPRKGGGKYSNARVLLPVHYLSSHLAKIRPAHGRTNLNHTRQRQPPHRPRLESARPGWPVGRLLPSAVLN
jgi:hypothetical protein